jgi:Glyoxalase superfamily protein
MLEAIHPKLPMRSKVITKAYYEDKLGFIVFGKDEFNDYLMLEKDNIQIHFFLFESINPKENYGQVYIRVKNIENFYKSLLIKDVTIHPNGALETKPWGQKEFALLDPNGNLLTFGESI